MGPLRFLSAAVLGLSLAACGNAGQDLSINVPTGAGVTALVFLDRDGSRSFTAADTAFAGLGVNLIYFPGTDTAAKGTTDGRGVVTFANVPLGQFTVNVDSASLGDSLALDTVSPQSVTVTPSNGLQPIAAALNYPVYTIAQARAAPVGRRVRLSGMILSGVQSFADTSAHLLDSTGALRLLDAVNVAGANTNIPGDSVSVVGMVDTALGQRVLSHSRMATFGFQPLPPLPDTLTTAAAATAVGGSRDADLTAIAGGLIIDTLTVGTAFRVTVDDGSGPLEMLLDPRLGYSTTPFQPGRHVTSAGVLVPDGVGAWQLKPREVPDISVF
jgi:hypothetical protein